MIKLCVREPILTRARFFGKLNERKRGDGKLIFDPTHDLTENLYRRASREKLFIRECDCFGNEN